MTQVSAVVIGIDVGTSGVRAVAATAEGGVRAEVRAPLADLPVAAPAHEQDANAWWHALCRTTQELVHKLRTEGGRDAIRGVAVTSTSGSLVLADSEGRPLRAAILYDDGRAGAVASELNRQLADEQAHVNTSFSLAKALWVRQQEPGVWERVSHIMHPADWLSARLTGDFGFCDYSNALKLGYDHENHAWAQSVQAAGIPASLLPQIVAPGDQVGVVSARASEQSGLNVGLPVLASASDGLASLIGSGASEPGDANTTLGTTLVWKVLATSVPRLGQGMYCHHLPNKLRVPGAASNTGPGSLRIEDAGVTAAEMDQRAAAHLPASIQCYLLRGRGERFPFLSPQATTFFDGHAASLEESYAAQLQSLACVERWGYERLEACGVTVAGRVFSAGSAADSPVLSQLRANLLNRTALRCAHPTAAFGAAILAAGTVLFAGDFTAATRAMPRVLASYVPDVQSVSKFEEAYQLFRAACERHGFA